MTQTQEVTRPIPISRDTIEFVSALLVANEVDVPFEIGSADGAAVDAAQGGDVIVTLPAERYGHLRVVDTPEEAQTISRSPQRGHSDGQQIAPSRTAHGRGGAGSRQRQDRPTTEPQSRTNSQRNVGTAAIAGNKADPNAVDTANSRTTTPLDRAALLREVLASTIPRAAIRNAEAAGTETEVDTEATQPLPNVHQPSYEDQRHQLARLNLMRQLLANEGLRGANIRSKADLQQALALGFAWHREPQSIANEAVVHDPQVSEALIDAARRQVLDRRNQAYRILTADGVASSTSELDEIHANNSEIVHAASDVIARISAHLREAEEVLGGENAQDLLERIELIINTQGLSPLTIVTAEWAVGMYYGDHLRALRQSETEGTSSDAPVRLFDPLPEMPKTANVTDTSSMPEPGRRKQFMAESQDRVYELIRQLRDWRKELEGEGLEADEVSQTISEWAGDWLGLETDELEQIQADKPWQAIRLALRARIGTDAYDAINNEASDRLGVDLDNLIALSLKMNEGRWAAGYSVDLELKTYTDQLIDMVNRRLAGESHANFPGVDWMQIRSDLNDMAQRAVARAQGWFGQLREQAASLRERAASFFDSGAEDEDVRQSAYAQAQAYPQAQARSGSYPSRAPAPQTPHRSAPRRAVEEALQEARASGFGRPRDLDVRELTEEQLNTLSLDEFYALGLNSPWDLPDRVQERLRREAEAADKGLDEEAAVEDELDAR